MLGLRQPGTPESESDGDVQSDNTVLSVIFRSSYLRKDVKTLKTCRLVSKSWNTYATESLATCSKVRLGDGGSKFTSLRTLLLNRTLGSFQNYPTPFQNYDAFATSFTDRDFVDFFLNNPMRGLTITLSSHDENKSNFDFERFNLVMKANQASIENLSVTGFNRDVQWDEGDEALISDEIQLTSLKTLDLSDSCEVGISACRHGQFVKKILSMCKPQSIKLNSCDGVQFVNLLSQDNIENLRDFCLESWSLSSDSWENLGKLRFPRLTTLSFFVWSGPSDDDLPKWDSFCQNISPLLEKLKTTCPISDSPSLIFPNLKRIHIENDTSVTALTHERFPSLNEVVYDDESGLLELQEDATSPHLEVQYLKVSLSGHEEHPVNYQLLVLLTHMQRQFPKVSSFSYDFSDMDFSLAVISESFPKLKTLCLNGMCDFNCFSGLDKATLINHLEGGWPFERIPRLKSIMDFTELESITFERDFDIDPDMILYCMPRVPKLREISFHWNESLSVPLLRDSVGHLERIVIAICKGEKDTFKDVITQMGEMLPNTCVCFV